MRRNQSTDTVACRLQSRVKVEGVSGEEGGGCTSRNVLNAYEAPAQRSNGEI